MSKEIAVTKEMTLEALAPVFPHLASLQLDPTKPLPSGYSELFDEVMIEVASYNPYTAPSDQVERMAKASSVTPSRQKWPRWSNAIIYSGAAITAASLASPFLLLFSLFSDLGTIILPIGALGFTGGVALLLTEPRLGKYDVRARLSRFASPEVQNVEYQRRVAGWALQRYGVIMDKGWDSTASRTAADYIHVADMNGEKVYCYQSPDGWVLGTIRGGELPVITANNLVGA